MTWGVQDPNSIPTRLVPLKARPKVEVAPVKPFSSTRYLRAGWVAFRWISAAAVSRGSTVEAQRARALEVRALLERMGGVWIKVGQLLAMRNDIFSDAFCDVMAGLHDRATGFPFEDVRRIVEEELGVPLEAVFSRFEEHPFAAGSIGQLHEGELRGSGLRVAIKVQRPDVARSFKADLQVMSFMAGLASASGMMPEMNWDELMWELERTLGEELDYRLEAASIRRMRKNLRRHRVLVPKVFRRLSRERVLVMEFIEGVFMSDYIAVARKDPARIQAWEAENNVVHRKVGTRLYLSQLRQLFEDNLFHGDLHPGNILILRDSRIALIDFGSVGSLERGFLRTYEMFVSAIAREEFRRAAGLYLLMVPRLPPIDLDPVLVGLERSLKSWSVRTQTWGLPYHQRSISSCYGEMGRLLVAHGIPTAWAFLRVNRSQITVDASLRYLQPDADYFRLGKLYFEKARRRKGRRARAELTRGLQDAAQEAGAMVAELPEFFFHQLEWLRRRARNFEVRATRATFAVNVVAALAMQTFFVWLLVWGADRLRGAPELGSLEALRGHLPVLSTAEWFGLALLVLLWGRGLFRLRARFRQHDVALIDQMRG